MIWVVIAALALGTLAFKTLGPLLAGGATPPAALTRVIELLTPALLAALVVITKQRRERDGGLCESEHERRPCSRVNAHPSTMTPPSKPRPTRRWPSPSGWESQVASGKCRSPVGLWDVHGSAGPSVSFSPLRLSPARKQVDAGGGDAVESSHTRRPP